MPVIAFGNPPRRIVVSRVPLVGELLALEDGARRVLAVLHTPCAGTHDAEVRLAPEADAAAQEGGAPC